MRHHQVTLTISDKPNPACRVRVGDLHNFGTAVEKLIINGNTYFLKPRTTFWENLFFGETSSLKEIFIDTPFFNYFCLSEILHENQILQKEVQFIGGHDLNFLNYGFLLSYCFCLGIQDLNHGNVIRKASGVQPIDIEVVFSDLIGPKQTLLIGGPLIDFNRSALGLFFESIEEVTVDNAIELIKGFYQGCMKLLDLSDRILALLPTHSELYSKNNRVIFRNTILYSNLNLDFIPEERIQMQRGDIPYFFKKFSDNNVYYYKNKSQIEVVKNLPIKFQKIADNVGKLPEEIFAKTRMKNKSIPVGLLSLCSDLRVQLNGLSKIDLDDAIIEFFPDKIIFNSEKQFILKL